MAKAIALHAPFNSKDEKLIGQFFKEILPTGRGLERKAHTDMRNAGSRVKLFIAVENQYKQNENKQYFIFPSIAMLSCVNRKKSEIYQFYRLLYLYFPYTTFVMKIRCSVKRSKCLARRLTVTVAQIDENNQSILGVKAGKVFRMELNHKD